MYELWSARGSGGAIIEAILTLANAPVRIIDAPPWEDGPHLEKLRQVNPLGQVPVLILPDGTVMTESGAMVLLLGERHPEAGVVPALEDPLRPAFLRWLFFVTASIYATFRFDDHPERWVSGEDCRTELRERVGAARKAMLRQLDDEAGAPFFLGDRFTALDLYIATMSHWKPRLDWVSKNCPRLDAIVRRIKADPRLEGVLIRHFG
ncbi:glutathione S-transferase family protein [Pedomonas mirosovicensis]|uniref:glutathione S-transferase family protein n=1 Tax=Pedomonas mirosovicensis TaxID=2908641 RepID=UPI00216898A7|nr:glutathione S-transferase family protein [Pedomonas mirosovicensis]MCH8685027.1 glutathione S-transferase family protein [Pedomonas mirosovicensis]